MSGLLLDTHVLYWLVSSEDFLSEASLREIDLAQVAGRLYVSSITAWELSVAAQKPRAAGRPHLDGKPADDWFKAAVRATGARVVPINQTIAREAARVVVATGHKDPGDCHLIGTARSRRIPLVTRDDIILRIAARDPAYLSVVAC